MLDRGKIARATAIVTGATIFSKILGFGREMALAAVFGASAVTDAYLVALIIPAVLFGIVGSTITTVGIPVFSEYIHQPEKRGELGGIIWATFHALLVVFAAVVLIGLPLAPWLVKILAPGFSFAQASLTVGLVRIMLPMVILMGLVGWAQGVLNAHQHFTMPALMGIPYNLIMIGGIFLAGAFGGIAGVAWATVLATVSQFFIQVPALYRHGITYRWTWHWRHPALRRMLLLAGPVIVGVGANQLNIVVDRMLASGLAEGSISALSYAQRALGIAQGLFAVPLITVLYPSLTERTALADLDGLRRALGRGATLLAFLILPLTAGLIVLRQDLVQFLFQRGAFDANDTLMTASALFFYSPGLIFLVWRDLLNRAFYALQDTVTPMWTGVAAVISNVVLNLILVRYLAHGGLALASSLAAVLACLLLFIFLRRRLGHIGGLHLLRETARIMAATLCMGVVVRWLAVYGLEAAGWTAVLSRLGLAGGGGPGGFVLQGLRLVVLIAGGALVYALCCRLFRVKEMELVFALLRKKPFLS